MTRAAVAVPLVALAAGIAALACGPTPRPGHRVEVTDETALIVWDPTAKTEHFVRKGSFRSTAPDFGFLVPTPTKPDLGESDPAVFDRLAAVTAPKVEYRRVKRVRVPLDHQNVASRAVGSAPPMPKAGAVEVLEQTKVGGYDATVIAFRRGEGETAAAGADVLAKWLKDRGYAFGPALSDWLTWYIEHGWVMTAFKVGGAAAGGVDNPPVRMSFRTDKPFYPYREPADQRAERTDDPVPPERRSGRLLRVFFVSPDGVATGTLGETGAWPAARVWADKLAPGQVPDLGPAVKPPAGDLTLTEFEDRSSPRPGTDEVYFVRHHDQTPVHRPPIVHEIVEWVDPEPAAAAAPVWVFYGLAAAVGAVAVFVAGYLVWVFRRP